MRLRDRGLFEATEKWGWLEAFSGQRCALHYITTAAPEQRAVRPFRIRLPEARDSSPDSRL